jgi:hypothetical protein
VAHPEELSKRKKVALDLKSILECPPKYAEPREDLAVVRQTTQNLKAYSIQPSLQIAGSAKMASAGLV